MLCVMAALVYLYLSAGVTFFSTWRQAGSNRAQVSSMEREHQALEAQYATLKRPGTVIQEARKLDMMRPGEQAYVVSGLPSN
jgi:cell division protein FtsB